MRSVRHSRPQSRLFKRTLWSTVSLAVAALLAALVLPGAAARNPSTTTRTTAATCGTTNLALNKTATASSTENGALPGLGRGGRQHRHPLVQRVQRPAVAGGRPRIKRSRSARSC